ncbi:MAG TPA: DUF721 domain-containing protein [Flavobacteriaceae bacterium]|nr:DUF721 domain-containing protein [Flavobacteriaceae bacterium]
MAKRSNENSSIGDVLQAFVAKNNLQKGLDKVHVKEVWNSEMGPPIAKYTTAIKLDRNTLHVELSSSVLREELSYGKEKIIRMLNEKLGKELVKKLVLR